MTFISLSPFFVNFVDTTTETETRDLFFLNGVEQLTNYQRNETQSTAEFTFLTPLTPETNNNFYVKYWDGYPFDISILRRTETASFSFYNSSVLLDAIFKQESFITRLFLSDVNTDENIETIIPIPYGRNVFQISTNNMPTDATTPVYNNQFLTIDKQDECEGLYIKWVNNYGGWNYWKFSNIYQQNQNTRAIGEVNTNFDNLENTYGTSAEIGKNANDRVIVSTDLLTIEEVALLQPLFTSPKIQLFTGLPFARASVNDWVDIKLLTSNYRLRNFKEQPASFTLEFELPDYYTMKL
jgi:hypothetical protein